MGKETKKHKHNVSVQRRKRHEKIRKLRAKLANADVKTREAIVLKLKKIKAAPQVEIKTK
jgi:hypothetical protein